MKITDRFWRNIPYIFSNGLFAFLIYPEYGYLGVLVVLAVIASIIYVADFDILMYRLTNLLKRIAHSDKWYLAYIVGIAIGMSVLPLVLLIMNYFIYVMRGGGKRIEKILENRG